MISNNEIAPDNCLIFTQSLHKIGMKNNVKITSRCSKISYDY